MRSTILLLAAALALAGGCSKGPEQGKPASSADKAPPQSQVNTPSTPAPGASTGKTASQDEKKEGANPVQGQVKSRATLRYHHAA